MKISKKLANIRRDYRLRTLTRDSVDSDPFVQFAAWMNEALTSEVIEPTAMTLATASGGGEPHARTVLLKGFDEKGFVFFSNYESRKADDLEKNPLATLLFFWPDLERQIIITGSVTKTSREESNEYFKTRPFESRIGAWASKQSSVIESRKVLDDTVADLTAQYSDGDLDVPPFWGGYRVTPYSFEFWQGRANRLHDRICYEREGHLNVNKWNIFRRSP